MHRTVKKAGGSLAVFIPRDLAELIQVKEGTPVRLSTVGRQLIIEPEDDTIPDATFQRSLATVLRRYGPAFEALAKHDDGHPLPARMRR